MSLITKNLKYSVCICMQNMREIICRKSPTMNSKICDFIKDQTVEFKTVFQLLN